VIGEHLALARGGPLLAGGDALGKGIFKLAPILDAGARQSDALAGGDNLDAEVILLLPR
jgi:hypothetical protein